MFGDLDRPLNALRGLSASAEFLVPVTCLLSYSRTMISISLSYSLLSSVGPLEGLGVRVRSRAPGPDFLPFDSIDLSSLFAVLSDSFTTNTVCTNAHNKQNLLGTSMLA